MNWGQWKAKNRQREKFSENLKRIAIHVNGCSFDARKLPSSLVVDELGYSSVKVCADAFRLVAKRGGSPLMFLDPENRTSEYSWAPGFLDWLFDGVLPWGQSEEPVVDAIDFDAWMSSSCRKAHCDGMRVIAAYVNGQPFNILDIPSGVRAAAGFSVDNKSFSKRIFDRLQTGVFIKLVFRGRGSGVPNQYDWVDGVLAWMFQDGFPWEKSGEESLSELPKPESMSGCGDSANTVIESPDLADGDLQTPVVVEMNDLQGQIGECSEQITALDRQSGVVAERVLRVTEEHDAARQEIEQMLARIRVLHASLTQLSPELIVLKDAQQQLEAERVELDEQMDLLSDQLHAAVARHERFKKAHDAWVLLSDEERDYLRELHEKRQ